MPRDLHDGTGSTKPEPLRLGNRGLPGTCQRDGERVDLALPLRRDDLANHAASIKAANQMLVARYVLAHQITAVESPANEMASSAALPADYVRGGNGPSASGTERLRQYDWLRGTVEP
jgi:hypothetical protein